MKKLLILIFLPLLISASYQVRGVNTNGLIGSWELSDKEVDGTVVRGADGSEDMTAVASPTFTTGITGIPNDAMTLNGSTQYCTQKVYDTEQGNLTFVADGGSAEFRDDGQDFSDWETLSGNAKKMLVVTSDNGTSWAYIGQSNNSGQDIDCYSDIELTTRGWKTRTTPQASGDTAASYKVLSTDFQDLSELTVCAWVKPNGAAVQGYIISKFASLDYGWAMWWDDLSKLRIYYNGIATYKESDAVFTENAQWAFIAVTKDSSGNVSFYHNGIAAGTDSGATTSDSHYPVRLGNRCGEFGYFNGQIQKAKIYNRALSATEIQNLYLADQAQYHVDPTKTMYIQYLTIIASNYISDTDYSIGTLSDDYPYFKFNSGSGSGIVRLRLKIKVSSDFADEPIPNQVWVTLWNDSSGYPDWGSGYLDQAGIDGSEFLTVYGYKDFELVYSLSPGTDYWIGIAKLAGSQGNAYIQVDTDGGTNSWLEYDYEYSEKVPWFEVHQ